MRLIDETHRLFSRDEAEGVAVAMRQGDPEWDYRPVHCPQGTGFSFVEIYDEDGLLVGRVR